MKILSWNVNGIRAAVKNGILNFINEENPEIVLLQEIKSGKNDLPEELHHMGYKIFINPAEKKGYSGTMALSKVEPLDYSSGIGIKDYDSEGRVQILKYDNFYIINTYFPNSQHGLTRLDYKIDFDNKFLEFCEKLRKEKPLIITGDFNVAHEEIDIARPKDNENNAGFTIQERNWMTEFLNHGYIDTYRYFHKEPGHYSWWSYRFNARAKNIGWRIDYFIVTDDFIKNVKDSIILENVKGSDHAPLELLL
ncbi:exodeoxyribonuclease III [Picrophilus oshimae]|uniref:Exodeoxyribonuclease-3 n=1 Tax=Picrophilus torridus (strain ATCC 700027 / DSM 9790 / JCM 10055 / NBRC 100828 / KAW 2/3) TaxID=1122961 RepID=A0A8G2FW03_PICTO|nr:exodeoxyribonuclease III [Picrophilus oshimae]SMD30483.1 exodeoxyribonuclease-3 [Picrophilus oshimae DSM 9789]